MRTWEEFKKEPRSFTNMSEEDGNLIDTLAYLQAIRIKRHISQIELGKNIGMSQPQIARIEEMEVMPTLDILKKYVSGLGFKVVPA